MKCRLGRVARRSASAIGRESAHIQAIAQRQPWEGLLHGIDNAQLWSDADQTIARRRITDAAKALGEGRRPERLRGNRSWTPLEDELFGMTTDVFKYGEGALLASGIASSRLKCAFVLRIDGLNKRVQHDFAIYRAVPKACHSDGLQVARGMIRSAPYTSSLGWKQVVPLLPLTPMQPAANGGGWGR